jgi:FkbM family methyltransferase
MNETSIYQAREVNKIMAPFNFPQLYSCINPNISEIVNTSRNHFHSQFKEDQWLWENIFKKLPLNETIGGSFLEIGGLDGIKFSNTYFFEKKLDWRGVLIEGHPGQKIRMSQSRRKNSAIFTTAICDLIENKPGNITFTINGGGVAGDVAQMPKQLINHWHKNSRNGSHGERVDCIPIQYIIDSTALHDIDLFSLDVEGSELAVLKTLDFQATNIRVIIVEVDGHNKEKDEKVRSLILSNDFIIPSIMKNGTNITINNKKSRGMKNEVFINPYFESRKTHRQLYREGTGVRC